MRPALLALAATTLVAGCGRDQPVAVPPATAPAGTLPPQGEPQAQAAAPATAEPALALGLTRRQLEDADLLDATGAEIGEIERVATDPAGAVTGLLVEIENSAPDRYVTIPLDGLTVVQQGDDRDLRGTLTRDGLLAMPATPR